MDQSVDTDQIIQAIINEKFEVCQTFDVIFVVLKRNGYIIAANEKTHQILGYAYPSLIGKNWFETCIPLELRDEMQCTFQQILQNNDVSKHRYTNLVITRDGTLRTIYWHNNYLRDHDDKIIGTVSTGQDITETLLLERKHREIEEMYHNVVECANDAILLTDLTGKINSVNNIATQILEYTIDELKGKSVFDFIAPTYHDLIKIMMMKKINGTIQHTLYEVEVISKSKTLIWIEVNSSILKQNGSPTAFHIIARDIRLRKREDDQRARSAQLEMTSLISRGIAHDFNNLLMGILGNVEMIYETRPTIEQREYLDNLKDGVMRATDLTRQLMSFSHMDLRSITSLNIIDVLKEAERIVMRGSHSKCIIQSIIENPIIDANKGQLVQVFANLFLNAAQAMPKGGIISVTITENQNLVENTTNYCVAVHDNGTGIPDHLQKHVFEPYFTTKPTGNGLGLVTSYNTIKSFKGTMRFESHAQSGTTFYIELPRSTKFNILQLHDFTKTSPQKINRGTILVVDDEREIHTILGKYLDALGVRHYHASSGESAIQIYQQLLTDNIPMDGILLDLTIPVGMGGREAAEQLLKLNPSIKIILISGYINDTTFLNHQKYGFYATLEKPFNLHQLSDVLSFLNHN